MLLSREQYGGKKWRQAEELDSYQTKTVNNANG